MYQKVIEIKISAGNPGQIYEDGRENVSVNKAFGWIFGYLFVPLIFCQIFCITSMTVSYMTIL